MTQQKSAQPRKNAELGAPVTTRSLHATDAPAITPRQMRVIRALSSTNGWIWREQIDRIAGASNGPAVIQQLRCKFTGYDGIAMELVDVADCDGRPAKPGRYRLTDAGRQRLEKMGVQ